MRAANPAAAAFSWRRSYPRSCYRGRRMAAVSRQPPIDRRSRGRASRQPQTALDLRVRRLHRILRRDFGRLRLRGRPARRAARHRPPNRQAALEVQGAGRHRRVVSRGSRWRRLHRRFFGPAACRTRRGRKGIVDLQNRGRDQVVARGDRRPRADRLLRWQPVLSLRARWQAALDVHHLELRARHAVRRRRCHLPGRLR